MAVCDACGQEMTDGVSCKKGLHVRSSDRNVLVAIPYYCQCGFPSNCPDCFAPSEGYHHSGCDREKCPFCEGQLISCGCLASDDVC